MVNLTESNSAYRHIEKMSTADVLCAINKEDGTIANAVAKALPAIEKLCDAVADHLMGGGKLYYTGAGTSGRLGVLDASEWAPTFGVQPNLVNGIIAGGEKALIQAIEFAEDNTTKGWEDLSNKGVTTADIVIGITAGGNTPYVIGAIEGCKRMGITTGCITCNPNTKIAELADFPVEVITGPEFITGSTRMKAGTAQKMVLNMLSSAVMIKLGRVEDNQMVHLQLTNEKLIERGARIVAERLEVGLEEAKHRLLEAGSVKKALEKYC